MMQPLQPLIKACWDICCLRKGPQDIPYSISLLLLATFLNALISLMLLKLQYSFEQSLLQILVMLGITWAFTYMMLRLRNFSARFVQTNTSLFATSTMISVLACPIWLFQMFVLQHSEGALVNLFSLFLLTTFITLNIWIVVITAHIFKHALQISFLPATVVTFAFIGLHVLASFYLGL